MLARKHRGMLLAGLASVLFAFTSQLSFADGNLQKVNHIIIVMQENHSFDNYFGVLTRWCRSIGGKVIGISHRRASS